MQNTQIGFIGCGNMASSLIGGLIADGFPAAQISVTDINVEKCQALAQQFALRACQSNTELAALADIIVLAVKPQQLKDAVEDVVASLKTSTLLLSVAAGVTTANIVHWLGKEHPVVRAMPNTPALVNSGATALYANASVGEQQRDDAEAIMRAVGVAVWVKQEKDMDTVTALSGSGPAYFFYMLEALIEHAVDMGLDGETAQILALQTAVGASKLAMESEDNVATLRQKVTSPGGTTERALQVMKKREFKRMVAELMDAAAARSQEISTLFGE